MNKQILKLAIPNIISNLTVPMLSMVDLAILGHMEDAAYIGAVALAGVIFSFIYAILSFLRMGTSGFTAQAYGKKDKTEQIMMLGRAILFAFIAGIVLIVLKQPLDWISFKMLGGSDEVRLLAREYFHIRIFAAPASLAILAFSGWFIGMQNARIPMYIALAVNLFNIIGNLIFVYGLGMKSDGLALGTVIAQYGGLILAVILFRKNFNRLFSGWRTNQLIDLTKLKMFFKVNADIMIRSVSLIFAFSFFTAQSAKFGDDILAANSILLQYLMIFAYLTDGFAHAAEALTGKYLGARKMDILRKVIRKLFFWGVVISFPFALIYLFAGDLLLLLLTDNEVIIAMAGKYLWWMALIPLTSFAAFIWDGIYIGATASSPMRNTLLISTFLVFLPVYYIFYTILGNHSLWLAMNAFMASRGILLSFLAPKRIFQKGISS